MCYFLERLSSEGMGRGEDKRGEKGKNRREVIRHHLAQQSQLRRLKSRMGIGRALVESDDAFSLLAACQLQACFYGYEAREEKPWGQKRRTDNNAKQDGPCSLSFVCFHFNLELAT